MWCRARVVGGHATIGRLSNNDFSTFQAIRNFFEKSRWTVTWQWSEVTRLSADCKTTFLRRFKQLEIFLKKVAERSRDSGRRSRDRRPTVKQRFFVRFKWFGKILKKVAERSRNSGWGHATVGRLSKTFSGRFKQLKKFLKKSCWTVTRQWSEVTRPSADCQTTFFGRFKRFGKILKKVAERSRDSGWGHATVGRLSNNVFWTFQAIRKILGKKSLNGHATVVGGHATVGRLSNNVFQTFQAIWENFEKKVAERSRDSGWGHATVGRLSNNVFWTFQAIWENFEKKSLNGHATMVEVTRPSADCQTTFLDVSSN